jgi:chemotaxis protein CheC
MTEDGRTAGDGASDGDGAPLTVNVDSLGTFYEMAREGAGLAARRLTAMTDIGTRVGVTRLHFTDPSHVRAELDDGSVKVGARVRLAGGLAGTSLVLFERDEALEAARTLVADVPDEPTDRLTRSAITELCHVMNSGFVDGWADVLRTEIDVSAPEFVHGDSPAAFLGEGGLDAAHDELALLFRSRIEPVGADADAPAAPASPAGGTPGNGARGDGNEGSASAAVGFEHYLIPEHDSIVRLFETQGDERGIEYAKLAGFDSMARKGAAQVAENLTRMTDIDMAVDIRRINFISLDAIPEAVANETLVSVAFRFSGMPSGYLLFLFEPAAAAELVAATVGDRDPSAAADDGFGAFERDAIQELSNVMTSGLLDGWANMLDTTIDHSTPAYTYDMGAAVIDPLIVGLSERQEFAFVFDTRIEAVDEEFDVDIYAIPDEDDLERALAMLDTARLDESPTSAEFSADVEADLVEELAGELDVGTGGPGGTGEHTGVDGRAVGSEGVEEP